MRMRLVAVALVSLFALAAAGPAGGQAPAPKEGVIAPLYPLPGNRAQLGIAPPPATKMAIDIVNTGGSTLTLPLGKTAGLPNLGGAKIRLIVVDHQGKPELGQA